VPLKSLFDKWPGDHTGVVHQQLRFDPMDSGGLLQGLNHMQQESRFYFVGIGQASTVCDEQISNHALAAFVNKKSVTDDSAAFLRRRNRAGFGIHVAQDHFS